MATKKQVQNESSAYGIASLACSIASWIIFGIILAPLGIIFGCISLSKNEKNKGLGIAGLIIGSVALAVYIFSLIIIATYSRYI